METKDQAGTTAEAKAEICDECGRQWSQGCHTCFKKAMTRIYSDPDAIADKCYRCEEHFRLETVCGGWDTDPEDLRPNGDELCLECFYTDLIEGCEHSIRISKAEIDSWNTMIVAIRKDLPLIRVPERELERELALEHSIKEAKDDIDSRSNMIVAIKKDLATIRELEAEHYGKLCW